MAACDAAIEAQSALADSQRFQLEGTYLSLAANVATASFREASLREQIHATEEIIDDYKTELDLVEKQNEIGAKSMADVLVIRTQVATVQATFPRCASRSRRRRRNSLCISASFRRRRNLPRSISMR